MLRSDLVIDILIGNGTLYPRALRKGKDGQKWNEKCTATHYRLGQLATDMEK